MLIELLSMSNYGHYNVKLAQVLGLEASVYLTEILNISEKAIRKNKCDGDFFTVDRKYITDRTTISSESQKNIERFLTSVGVIVQDQKVENKMMVNLTTLTNMMMSPDESTLKEVQVARKKSTRLTKKQSMAISLKSYIVTDNTEMVNAYCLWIDTLIDMDRMPQKITVISAQNSIDEFSNRNLDVALKVIEVATINGCRDMNTAISIYKRNYADHYKQAISCELPIRKDTPSKMEVRKRVGAETF